MSEQVSVSRAELFALGHTVTDDFVDAFMSFIRNSSEFSWLTNGAHHPDDIVANLIPTLSAFAAGWSEAMRRMAHAVR